MLIISMPSHGPPFIYKRSMESKKDTIINFLFLTTTKPIYEAKFPRISDVSARFEKVLTILELTNNSYQAPLLGNR